MGDGDMTIEEARKFRRGEGCPSCGFGKFCTQCNATGIIPTSSVLRPDCKTCNGQRYIIVRRYKDLEPPHKFLDHDDRYQSGYGTPISYFDKRDLKIIEEYPFSIRKDGIQIDSKALCPDCRANEDLERCSICKGTGLRIQGDIEAKLSGIESLLEASDEEPIGLLDEAGLL